MTAGWGAFAVLLTLAQAAQAQSYPNRPIRLIVGFAPSGSADIVARVIGPKLTETWKEPVVVENRPGAGSTIAAELTAKATPDGYTLTVVSASHATSAGLYQKLGYDPVNSFAAVSMIASGPNLLVAHPSLAVRSTRDLIAMVRAAPDKYTMGSAGTGTITHLSGELFSSMAGLKVVHVPYKGGGPGLIAVMGNEVTYSVLALPTAIGQVKAGRVRAFGVTTIKRSSALPDIPTVAESGVPGYEAANWWGMLAPAGTPAAIVARLNKQLAGIVRLPDMIATLADQGAEPDGGTSDAFKSYLKTEMAKWSKVIIEAKVPRQ
jgi:tripartite-type tricarboxylate transporter receptor subunit TctC